MQKALVIDDSRTMRMIVGRTVKDLGFDITEAGNGQEALDCLNRESGFALILCDWNMPVMNGFEFIQKIRTDFRYSNCLVVMVTTETDTQQMLRALEAGANEYIMKPFTRDTLEEKLRILGVLN